MSTLMRLSITTRLALAFGLVLAFLVGTATLSYVQVTRLWGAVESFEQQTAPSTSAVYLYSNAIKDLRRLEYQTILWVPDAAKLQDIATDASMAKAVKQANEALQQYAKLAADAQDASLLVLCSARRYVDIFPHAHGPARACALGSLNIFGAGAAKVEASQPEVGVERSA